MLARDAAQIMPKAVDGMATQPDPARRPWFKWHGLYPDRDPGRAGGKVCGAGVPFPRARGDTSDGQRGFKIADPDGYILFFGRPRAAGKGKPGFPGPLVSSRSEKRLVNDKTQRR